MVYFMHFSFYEKLCTYERFKSTYQTTEYNSYLNEYMSVFRTFIIFLIYMKILKGFFSICFNMSVKIHSLIVAPTYPGDHNLYKLEFTLPEDASTLVTACLADWFLRRRIL